jgi:hypothetical protein
MSRNFHVNGLSSGAVSYMSVLGRLKTFMRKQSIDAIRLFILESKTLFLQEFQMLKNNIYNRSSFRHMLFRLQPPLRLTCWNRINCRNYASSHCLHIPFWRICRFGFSSAGGYDVRPALIGAYPGKSYIAGIGRSLRSRCKGKLVQEHQETSSRTLAVLRVHDILCANNLQITYKFELVHSSFSGLP